MISVSSSGSFKNLEALLRRNQRAESFRSLEHYGQLGVNALSSATSVDSGVSKDSWVYTVTHSRGKHTITWRNTNMVDGVPVVILIQYGHATGTGGYVEGEDFINPAIKPVFDKIISDVWEEVTRNG